MTIADSIAIASEFKQIFNVNLNDYIMSEFKAFNVILLDIVKFDDYLMAIHKDYVDGVSMQKCILKHYGEKGNSIIEKLIAI